MIIYEKKLSWIEGADAALQRAALRVREVAAATNTAVIIYKDGKIVELNQPKLKDLVKLLN